nr:MAG TPA: hypothetical protein [Caudoviricetes sp.]
MHKNKHYAIILSEPFATFSIKLRVVFLFVKTQKAQAKSRAWGGISS